MEIHSGFESACSVLSDRIRIAVMRIDRDEKERITEIRLRLGRSLSVGFPENDLFVTEEGKLTRYPGLGIKIDRNDIEAVFQSACRYSVHSFQKEVANGFLTIAGGNRIGICGTAVVSCGKIENVRDISGLNIRIAREITGCAQELQTKLESAGIQSVLIAGPPSSGKTTILRDLCRIIGQTERISVIDERNELSATFGGMPQYYTGAHSDVFCGYPKADGIITAIRVMSPKIIICDEIGTAEDVEALEKALYTGVRIIATVHAGSIEDAKRRKGISKLIKDGAFDATVLLGSGIKLGKILRIQRSVEKSD